MMARTLPRPRAPSTKTSARGGGGGQRAHEPRGRAQDPNVALGVRPLIDRAAVTDQPAQLRDAELGRRPLVQRLEARSYHPVVEQPPDAALVSEVRVEMTVQRIASRHDPSEGQKRAGHARA